VRDEIEHAKSYLIIQQIRYKNKFDFSIDAQPEVLEHRTQKLILQPIVENAIYHGVANLQEKGHILIKVAVENNGILFQIADNGYGIKPELLKGLLDRESKSEQGSGVGLKNVNERIKLYYGRQYGIEIISELEVGTTVNIRIPMTGCKEAE
jgi:two-component system sensor histidine kinase YesM